MYYKQKYKYES